jgi:hypothetical protein
MPDDVVLLHAVGTAVVHSLPKGQRREVQNRLGVLTAKWPQLVTTVGQELAWKVAYLHIRGRLSRPRRCDALTLLVHRTVALELLEGMPQAKQDHTAWTKALEARLPELFSLLAEVPCMCGQKTTRLPHRSKLAEWPTTVGAVIPEVLGWYHNLGARTMRRKLTEASATMRTAKAPQLTLDELLLADLLKPRPSPSA